MQDERHGEGGGGCVIYSPFFPGEVQLLLLEGDLASAAAIFSFSEAMLKRGTHRRPNLQHGHSAAHTCFTVKLTFTGLRTTAPKDHKIYYYG